MILLPAAPRLRVPGLRLAAGLCLVLAAQGCASGSSSRVDSDSRIDEAAWAALATPRPTPAAEAPRITVIDGVAAMARWTGLGDEPGFALAELVAAGLLERTDLHFVERRRFGPAARAAQLGESPAADQPPIGSSPAPQWGVTVAFTRAGDAARADLTLTDFATSEVRDAWSFPLPAEADPVGVARVAIRSLADRLAALDDGDAPATWTETPWTESGVEPAAVAYLLRGVRAGDRWDWDAAGRDYRSALSAAQGDFPEAEAALRRAARLRAGGTLAGS